MSPSISLSRPRTAALLAVGISTGGFLVPGSLISTTVEAASCSPTAFLAGDGWTYAAFTDTNSCTWTPASGVTQVDFLAVGGGASGSVPHGGGGGAGGVRTGSFTVTSGDVTVSVGAGGAGRSRSVSGNSPGLKGEDTTVSFLSACASSATSITALGGGPASFGGGSNGGSGGSGGGILDTTGSGFKSGSGAPLQGNSGGNGRLGFPYASGGGGGASTAASDGGLSGGGSGGAGTQWLGGTFDGTIATELGLSALVVAGNVYFAGGGGGGATAGGNVTPNSPGGTGGNGGGGNGGAGGGTATTSQATGTDGVAGSGGGGGGGGLVDNGGPDSAFSVSGSGGSGIVILRYRTDDSRTPICLVPTARFISQGSPAPVPSTYTFTYTSADANRSPLTPTITGIAPLCASMYAATDAEGVTHPIYCAGGSDPTYLFDTSSVSTATVGEETGSSYTFAGFFQPVDNGGTVNLVKGGSVVPFKFLVYEDANLMTDPTKILVLVERLTCGSLTAAPSDVIEFTAPGSSALRWDGTQFIHNWRIPTAKNVCYGITYTIASETLRVGASSVGLSAMFRTR